MSLPTIDFSAIASVAKQTLEAYGTTAQFSEQGTSTWRNVKAVVYKEAGPFPLEGEAYSIDATAILNPDEYASPYRMPRKFDSLRISVGGFTRTYSIDSVNPIIAADTLPLVMVRMRAN